MNTRAKVHKLREQGLTYAQIGAEVGLSESYCHLLCNPDKYRQHRIRNGEINKRRYRTDPEFRAKKLRQNREWLERNG